MSVSHISVQSVAASGPFFLGGGIAAWLAVHVYRRGRAASDEVYTDLWLPHLALCVVFALGVTGYGLARLIDTEVYPVEIVLGLCWLFPWTAFGLSFAGRGHLVTRRRAGVAAFLIGLFAANELSAVTGAEVSGGDSVTVMSLFTSVLVLGLVAVAFTTVGFVLLSAYRHRSLSTFHGLVVALAPIEIIFGVQLTRPSQPVLNGVVFGAMSLAVAGTLFLVTTRYDVLRSRAGTGTIGERAAIREMDEAMLTVERNGTLARANRAASELFGSKLDDTAFAEIVGHDVPELVTQGTVECWTERGRRQFDPRVQELTNRHDEVLGHAVTLIDVTDREIRRQRIEVLNRILRHNIRNSLDVIRANAEQVTDESRAVSILDTTDTLDRLSADARHVETLMRRSQGDQSATELETVLRSVRETIEEQYPEASVSFQLPALSFTTEAELCRFALRNVLENAIVHNDNDRPRVEVRGSETDTGVRLVVADDGPGIPEAERSVIENQSESPQSHLRSLGLWGTNWAVQQLGGHLSFEESDLGGAAVVIELPEY